MNISFDFTTILLILFAYFLLKWLFRVFFTVITVRILGQVVKRVKDSLKKVGEEVNE